MQFDSCMPITGGFGLIYKDGSEYKLYGQKAVGNAGLDLGVDKQGKKFIPEKVLSSTPTAEESAVLVKVCEQKANVPAVAYIGSFSNRRTAALYREHLNLLIVK